MSVNEEYAINMSLLLNGEGKSYFIKNNLDLYYSKIESALIDLNKGLGVDYLCFSFISLCSATLEYSLNLIYSDFFLGQFACDYEPYAKAFYKMEFKLKLRLLPYIISNGKFIFNENYKTFQSLNSLIKLRNLLLHPNGCIEGIELGSIFPNMEFDGKNLIIETENTEVEFSVNSKESTIETLNKRDCINYGLALLEFRDLVLTPFLSNHNIEENSMVRLR
ncbi:MAG: hypothetical protein IJE43_17340 [Alphaproteobacteria bacterium]|nr:hypothetical protein [Alphaproteobacteria bacterium]